MTEGNAAAGARRAASSHRTATSRQNVASPQATASSRPPAHALPPRAMRVVVAALVIGLLPTFLVGALSVPIGADLEVGTGAIGGAVSAFFIAASSLALFSGRTVDRIGARRGYRIGLLGVATAAGGIGLLAGEGWHLVVGFALGGAGLSFVDPSIARTIAGSVGWRRQGIGFGIKETAVPTASMIAGLTLPLLGPVLGWQVPFVVVALLAVGLAALVPSDIESIAPSGSVPGSRSRSGTQSESRSEPVARPQLERGRRYVTRAMRRGGVEGSIHRDVVSDTTHPDSAVDEARSDTSTDSSGPTGTTSVSGRSDTTSTTPAARDDAPSAQDPADGPAQDAPGAPDEHPPYAPVQDPPDGPVQDATDGPDEDPPDVPEGDLRSLALLAAASGIAGGAGAAVATFVVPTALVLGLGATAAGMLLSTASVGSLLIRLGSGWFVDRRPQAVFDMVVGLLAAGALGMLALALAAHAGPGPVAVDALAGEVAVTTTADGVGAGAIVLLVVGAVLVLGPGWGWTGLVFLTATRLVPSRPAQASGAILTGLGAGGALFPLGAGWLAESVGFGWTWTWVALAMTVSVALMMVVRAKR